MDRKQGLGVPASPSGSKASPEAASASSPSVTIPNAGEWRRECSECEGEGTVERTDLPLHHLHSEEPEYAQTRCGECDGDGWSWTDELVSLAECPIGLFWHGETLCLKTEYGNNEGRIDAYIVESGEFYWGDQPQSIASQRAGLVLPVEHDFAVASLTGIPG